MASEKWVLLNALRMPRMKKPVRKSAWAKSIERGFAAMTRMATASGTRGLTKTLKPVVARRTSPPGAGAWIPGAVMGATGARRFRLYRPPGVQFGERLPLMVMLHGCGQDANSFAASTRMNRIAMRERFLVLYPEQDRLANGQGCWNWFDTGTGRAYGEAALIMKAIDQVCLLHPVDKARVAIAGLSAGASMAALLVTRHPGRFKAVVMHSGIPPGTAHSPLSALGAMHGHRPTMPLAATPSTMEANWPPLLVIHGDADAVVSPSNGQAAVQVWASAAGARASQARSVQRGKRYPMSVTDFKRKGSTVATLVAVNGLAHAWSGGAASKAFSDGQGPDASRMAWAFAAKQFQSEA
jgi:poly(hydroxyalkanoate) depolymerase family esterase